MKFFPPRSRIALGLTSAVVGILFFANLLGILQSPERERMVGRARLSESVALSGSAMIARDDMAGLSLLLRGVVDRNDDVRSAGVRDAEGTLTLEEGPHQASWEPMAEGEATNTQMQVPVFKDGADKWGTIEVRFEPLTPPGIKGWIMSPMMQLVSFVSITAFTMFSAVLRTMLKHLDPSKAVPKHVRDALDSLAEGLLILDENDQVLLANQAFEKVLGAATGKLVGHRASTFGWRFPSEHQTEFPWKTALQKQRPMSNVRLHLDTANDGRRTFSVNCSPLLGHQGKCVGVMVTFDDVTLLEEKNEELGEAKQAAEAANRAKSEFLANMSHEIRTPMNAIMGFTDVLRRGMEESENERLEHLDTIHDSGEHLISLINDILDLSKIEANKLTLEILPCSPVEVVKNVVNVLRVKAEQKDLDLSWAIKGEVPETVTCDPTRVRQILINIAGNAIKFTHKGGVKIVCRFESTPEPQLYFDVIDTGIGMSTEQTGLIFTPFEQADASVTRKFGGTGLGLAISKRFAEAMGGNIVVESVAGEGSTFRTRICVGVDRDVTMLTQADVVESKSSRRRDSHVPRDVRIRPVDVLLVDDGASNRKLVKLILNRVGVTVTEAENGQEAVDLVTTQDFAVVLLDMQMPVMDGYTAAKTMRAAGHTMPIVALTANAMQGDEEKCRRAGCSHFLTKPVDMDALIDLLIETIGMDENPPKKAVASASNSNQKTVTTTNKDRVVATSKHKIVSTLPTDDPEFRKIVNDFIVQLPNHLREMHLYFDQRDYESLAKAAHWLKGAGGTVGFDEFTAPARELERLAHDEDDASLASAMTEIISIAECIELIPESTSDPQRVTS